MSSRFDIGTSGCISRDYRYQKRGFMFSIDALIAATILISGLLILSSMQVYETDTEQLSASSQDIMQSMSVMRVGDLKSSWVQDRINNASLNGSISDPDATVIEQIGVYWASGDLQSASMLSQIFLNGTGGAQGLRLSIEGTQIYLRNSTKNNENTVVSTRSITGIAQNKAMTGSSASAYLRHIKNKRTAMFIPIGGYVGEGNISILSEPLPSDANVTDIIIELDTEQDFLFYVNGGLCDHLVPNSTPLVPSMWSRANCSGLISPGNSNVLSFKTNGTVSGSAIAGGYVKVVYVTDQLNDMNTSAIIYRFPQVEGLINVYDGFSIPGSVNSMNITMNFTSAYDTYLTIGNASFTFTGSNVTQNITLNDTQIRAALNAANLSYSDISRVTVPLRFGIGNVVISGNPADVVVVTDTSGSMAWCITDDDPTPCPPGDITKISSAKNVTTQFVTSLLNGTSGMRVGLTEFANDVKSWSNLTSNATPLIAQINTYAAADGTCICCGINNATDTLTMDGQLLLIQRGSSGWKYNDSNLGSQPSGWANNSSTYNDSGWKNGTTNIGWGYAGQSTTIGASYRYQGDYYYRKWFNVTNASNIAEARLYVFSDDGADVYLNGIRIDNNRGSTVNNGIYWNREEIVVNKSRFVTGMNLIAVRQYHSSWPNRMGFDLALVANVKGNMSSAQRKNIVIMTDGEANVRCSRQNTGDAVQDAIKAACDAYTNYGIITYTVGFGLGADNATMQAIANCTTGQYFNAKNDTALKLAFQSIGNTIIQSSSTQTAIATGNVSKTVISYDSIISADYAPDVTPPQPNEISVTLQTPPLQSCNAVVPLYPGMRFIDAKVYSYSADYWTSRVIVNNVPVYNLSKYSMLYSSLGDPYQFTVPSSLLTSGNNTVGVMIAIDGYNTTINCSSNNTFVYTVSINLSTERSPVVPNSSGCKWQVEFQGGSIVNMTIPTNYNGSNSCYYKKGIFFSNITNSTVYAPNVSYNYNDSYQLGAFSIFDRLDFKKDGTLFVDLSADDLEVIVTTISKVPYLWGPSVVLLEVTR